MKRNLLYIQAILLAIGTAISWFALIRSFQGFYTLYGTVARFKDCIIPNPIATPCFYGALAFLGALVWSIVLLNSYSARSERYLKYLLLFGTLFATSVLGYETVQYYHIFSGPTFTCSPGVHPLLTPCFYGGVIYLISFLVARRVLSGEHPPDEMV